jgi:hypothetical protein
MYAMGKLAIQFVSGPGAIASVLRTGLLPAPFNTRSVPLDVGYSDHIPETIRRAVIARARHCEWPGGCDRPPSACDVHHLIHKKDGGPTSVTGCGLFCDFHHDVCIHRWGWQVEFQADGTVTAVGPDGQVIRGHPPPSRARLATGRENSAGVERREGLPDALNGPGRVVFAGGDAEQFAQVQQRHPFLPLWGRGIQLLVDLEEAVRGRRGQLQSMDRSTSAQVNDTAGSMTARPPEGWPSTLPDHRSPCVRTAGIAGMTSGMRSKKRSSARRSAAVSARSTRGSRR